MCNLCVFANSPDLLKWLRNIDNYRTHCRFRSDDTEICPWNSSLCVSAAGHNCLRILKIAVDNCCLYDSLRNLIEIYPMIYNTCKANKKLDEYIKALPNYK